MLLIALLVWANMGSPVLFRQARPGLQGKSFVIYKFRTMCEAYGEDGNLLPDEQRLTRLGKWLRSTSLDEQPGFTMCLGGDEPLWVVFLCFYTANFILNINSFFVSGFPCFGRKTRKDWSHLVSLWLNYGFWIWIQSYLIELDSSFYLLALD